TRSYDRIVSTIPIPLMLNLIGDKPDVRIDTMNLYSLFYRGDTRDKWTVLFNFSLSGPWKRIINYSETYCIPGPAYFTVEITTPDISEQTLRCLREGFEGHIAKLNVFSEAPEYLGEIVTKHAYPIFRRGDSANVERERAKL